MENSNALTPRHTSLIEISKLNPLELFKEGGSVEMLEKIKLLAFEGLPNADTAKGRKAIISRAARVSTSKTMLNDLRISQVEDQKKALKLIDIEGKYIQDCMAYLKAEIREPTTKWEDGQKAVKAEAKLEKEKSEAWDLAHDHNQLVDRGRELDRKEAESKKLLNDERIRKEGEERERKKGEQEKVDLYKKQAEDKLKLEKAEQEKVEAEKLAKTDRELAVKLAELNAKDAADEKERKRLAAEALAKREAETKAANKEHRGKYNRELLQSILESDYNDENPEIEAKNIIKKIFNNKWKHVSVNY